jgi:nucleoid-associated protein YejK
MAEMSKFPPVRKSITFVPPSVKALNELTEATQLSDTDVVNKAVQVYAFINVQTRSGKKLALVDEVDGRTEYVHIV